MVVGELLRTSLYPGIAAAAIGFFIAGILAKSSKAKDIWTGFGLGVGFTCGFLAVVGWVPLPPIQVTHWLLWFALIGWLAFSLLNTARRGLGFWLVSLSLAAVPYAILEPFFERWGQGTSLIWVLGLTLCMFLLFVVMRAPEAKQNDLASFFVLIVAATGASLVNVLDGGALNGQLGGSLASACGGLFLARCLSKELALGSVAIGVFIALFSALLMLGHFYVEVAPFALILVATSPLALLLHSVPVVAAMSQTKRFFVLVAASAIPVAIAVAILAARAAEETYGY